MSEDFHRSPGQAKHACSYSLVQNKVEIKSPKAWRWATLPLVLMWSNVGSGENNQRSTKHEEPGALRHYSSCRRPHTDEVEDQRALKRPKLSPSWSTLQILAVLLCNIQWDNNPAHSNRFALVTGAVLRISLHWHTLITGPMKQAWEWDELHGNSKLHVEASACRNFCRSPRAVAPSPPLSGKGNAMQITYPGTSAT